MRVVPTARHIAVALALASSFELLPAIALAQENVALGKSVTATGAVNLPVGGANRITNGVFNAESTQWQTNSVWWNGITPSLTINLGGLFDIVSFRVQADNNDTYMLQYWSEPASAFLNIYGVPAQPNGGGMATRPLFTLSTPIETNQLRFFATGGDNSYSVSQIEAFGTAVTATPEPASLLLLATGLVGVAVARRRKATTA